MKDYEIRFDAVKMTTHPMSPADYLPILQRRLTELVGSGRIRGFQVSTCLRENVPVIRLAGVKEKPGKNFFGPLVPEVYTVHELEEGEALTGRQRPMLLGGGE